MIQTNVRELAPSLTTPQLSAGSGTAAPALPRARPALWCGDANATLGNAGAALRERLQPYVATLLRDSAEHGTPVLRSLIYNFPDDPIAYALDDQALIGPWLLVAPLAAPAEQRRIYIPAGRWYNWWTGAAIQGPAWLCAPTPPGQLPLYARAGAIIPSWPTPAPGPALTLDVFPGDGALTLYADEPDGDVCATCFRLRADAGPLHLSIGARPPAYPLVLRVHAASPDSARAHQGASYDAARHALVLALDAAGPACTLTFALEDER